MRFNVNHEVKVRLTERGLAILESKHWDIQRHLSKPRPFSAPKIDADGFSLWQMWDLMATFGDNITMGLEPPFETEIIIDDSKELQQACQIITDLVEYAECNDPGNPHLARAKGFLSGGDSNV